MRAGEPVFVDTGAWIALALTRDPLHARAREIWDLLTASGVRLWTSVPVVIETFTFLERNTTRETAITWKDSLRSIARLKLLECRLTDLDRAWEYFKRRNLHKLSAVDATSFVLMVRAEIRVAFAFDSHFAAAGFRLTG